ncbi:hypothetical protein KOR42_04820 [Thalassoglobus neptunius]|uniref:Uncharacterized protein n=1 Tax=Thalassoglobus neptunius TaxID=1938619 RepID=A0A5C5X1W3_9PLAN|nr:hypothetical protein [Thalassoglobus neptunius]TWT57124.1 hypothetical protein KOR42_04820 [Thalassoglobus neptunius]
MFNHLDLRNHIRTLSSLAWDSLNNSEFLKPGLIDERGLRFGRPRLWRTADGFHDYEPETLTIFQPFKDESPLIRKAIWNRSADMKRVFEISEDQHSHTAFNPVPTITIQDASIEKDGFEAILVQANEIRLPLMWPWSNHRDNLTEDVGKVGMEVFDIAQPQASLRLEWSAEPPPEWKPALEWFDQMSNWLESQLKP